MRWQCVTCAGIYDDVGPDGVRYFHACPPLRRVLLLAPGGQTVVADHAVAVDLVDDGTGKKTIVRTFTPPLPPGHTFVGETTIARPNRRDENVAGVDDQGRPVIKAPGGGVVVVP